MGIALFIMICFSMPFLMILKSAVKCDMIFCDRPRYSVRIWGSNVQKMLHVVKYNAQ